MNIIYLGQSVGILSSLVIAYWERIACSECDPRSEQTENVLIVDAATSRGQLFIKQLWQVRVSCFSLKDY